jgi:hypothetical protein
MNRAYYDGPGLGMSALGQAVDSSPLTVSVRPTGVLIGAWWSLSTVSGLLSAYHGYRRNNGNLGWALAWFLAGSALPIVVPAIAFTQGYAKSETVKSNGRRARRRSGR